MIHQQSFIESRNMCVRASQWIIYLFRWTHTLAFRSAQNRSSCKWRMRRKKRQRHPIYMQFITAPPGGESDVRALCVMCDTHRKRPKLCNTHAGDAYQKLKWAGMFLEVQRPGNGLIETNPPPGENRTTGRERIALWGCFLVNWGHDTTEEQGLLLLISFWLCSSFRRRVLSQTSDVNEQQLFMIWS